MYVWRPTDKSNTIEISSPQYGQVNSCSTGEQDTAIDPTGQQKRHSARKYGPENRAKNCRGTAQTSIVNGKQG